MAPRSQKRARIAPHKNQHAATSSSSSNVHVPARAYAAQTSVALELPVELLTEILSYFSFVPIDVHQRQIPWANHLLPPSSLERTDALRALSQTCRKWRTIFLSMLWNRVEATAVHSETASWYHAVGNALERKCLWLTRNPAYAVHVRSMRVILSHFSESNVLPTFVQCVNALPNLDTLAILFATDDRRRRMRQTIKSVFDGYSFPYIRTVALPTHTHDILKSCPSVNRVICVDGSGSEIVGTIGKYCNQVQVLEGLRPIGGSRMVKRIAKAMPNLRSIRFSQHVEHTDIHWLAGCKMLSHIGLFTSHCIPGSLESMENCINEARKVLRSGDDFSHRSLELSYVPWNVNRTGWSRYISLAHHELDGHVTICPPQSGIPQLYIG